VLILFIVSQYVIIILEFEVIFLKKGDLYLIGILLFIGLLSLLVVTVLKNQNEQKDGVALVYYENQVILEIYLEDGTYQVMDESRIISIEDNVFHVEGSNPYGVYIQYQNNSVGVIDEESPKHICQYQGFTNSSLSPITCLPNNIVIVIKANDTDLDTIGG
jgi:hypothetical protein